MAPVSPASVDRRERERVEKREMILQAALRLFLDPSGGQSSFGGLFAMVLVSIGPVLGFFLASQRLLVRGIATTGLK